ncbi:MAG: GNAT family N-acetyltransferase [Janthinobacterium lividum]
MDAFPPPYSFRLATASDATIIAKHRAQMFRDMGCSSDDETSRIFEASVPWFHQILSDRSYVGWLVLHLGTVVASGGIHIRDLGPVPGCCGGGRLGHIANIYTEPAHRRRGVARSLVTMILTWATDQQLDKITLSASNDGRSLYEKLGFVSSHDMQLP